MEVNVTMTENLLRINWTPALEAMQEALLLIRETWEQAVLGQQLPGMTKSIYNEAYANSLKINAKGMLEGDVSTDYAGAQRLENGGPAYDMKPSLLHGPHHKTNKKGQPYTIVPFRHGSPSATGAHFPPMPMSVYRVAKKLGAGQSLGNVSNQYGVQTKNFVMQTGSMLDKTADTIGYGIYTHKTSIYSNMVRKTDESGKHTQYMTFRTVSTKSDPMSWWHPATQPNHIRDAVVDAVQREVEEIIQTGWKALIA